MQPTMRDIMNLVEAATEQPDASSHEMLDEGVALDGDMSLAAFAVTLAEAYEAAPVHDKSADKLWNILKRHTIDTLLPRIKGSGIKVEFTEGDPYTEFGKSPKMMVRAMLADILINKRLLIYSGEDSVHPNFTTEENCVFRTIHDFLTHGKLLATFKKNLYAVAPEIAQGKMPTPDELAKALPQVSLVSDGNMGHSLTMRGELNAAATHIRIAPKAAAPALFTEVAAQVATFFCTGKYAEFQKVAVLPGFDYEKIGKCLPGSPQEARMKEVLDFLKTASPEDMLPMNLKQRPQVKVARLLKNVNSHDPMGARQ